MASTITINGPLYPYTENDSRLIEEEVSKLDPMEPIDLHIHSPGGSVWEGKKLFNLFMARQAPVHVYVDGLAGSAASFLAMAGSKLFVYDYSEFMIHSAMTWIMFMGNARELEKLIPEIEKEVDGLRSEDKVIANLYAKRASIDVSKVTAWMEAETTWRGKEILDVGFATDLIETPARGKENLAKYDLSGFKAAAKSGYHEKFCEGIDSYMSWFAANGGLRADIKDPAGTDTGKIRQIAVAQAAARNRVLEQRKKHPGQFVK